MQADPALHLRLGELGIEPQLYLLRWLRLLFGREFHFEDVKLLWDAIFAFGVDETDRHASMHADANGSHITGGEIAATVDAPPASVTSPMTHARWVGEGRVRTVVVSPSRGAPPHPRRPTARRSRAIMPEALRRPEEAREDESPAPP